LRGIKHTSYEGGVRTPLLLRWPAVIPAGTTTASLASLSDVLATTAALVGASLPRDAAEDSYDLSGVLRDPASAGPRQLVIVRGKEGFALREGGWKWIERTQGGELYDLATDPAESRNLAASQPERAQAMRQRLAELLAAPRTAP
jgi:arylsulfatase A